MIEGKKILAIIPARGGSKGLPRKNLLEAGGKPLIAWTIEEGLKSAYIDRLILSSEDPEIMATAKKWGCEVPFSRPPELADDKAATADVVLDALAKIKEQYDYVVLLQPTSPLRSSDDIDLCIKECHESGATSCVTVTKSDKSPFWMFFLDAQKRMEPVIEAAKRPTRRQDLPNAYTLNGAVYVVNREWFQENGVFVDKHSIAHVMPKDRSIDIDSEDDLNIFRYLITAATGS